MRATGSEAFTDGEESPLDPPHPVVSRVATLSTPFMKSGRLYVGRCALDLFSPLLSRNRIAAFRKSADINWCKRGRTLLLAAGGAEVITAFGAHVVGAPFYFAFHFLHLRNVLRAMNESV